MLLTNTAASQLNGANTNDAAARAKNRIQEHELRQRADWWLITVKYPTIDGLASFNAAVRQQVSTAANNFRKELPGPPSEEFRQYGAYLNGTYTIRILKNDIITVLFDYDEYVAGAAHPWEVVASINYDSRTGRVLSLSDLFRPGSNYVPRLSELCIELLNQRQELPEEETIRHGAGPDEKNFQVFTLSDHGLVVHFQQYQVGPGVVPALEIEIPLPKLEPLLRERYVIR
jgi:hypothetical protein